MEALGRRYSITKFFIILQNLQEKTCNETSFLRRRGPATLLQRDSGTDVLLCVLQNV